MTLISYLHRFIFIKNLKTAGTSLEVHLARQCGGSDIVTEIEPPRHGHRPRNFTGTAGNTLFYNHMPATLIRDLLPGQFGDFFKFCFERHPVDKCLSHCAMIINSPRRRAATGIGSWEAYIERGEFPLDTGRYTDERGDLLVDKVYKYEALTESLSAISTRLGMQDRPLLVREKANLRYGVPSVAEVMARRDQRTMIFDAFGPTLRFVDYC